MRASFIVMGALIGRMGKARSSMPGGCAIGARPVDLHLKGFRSLGVNAVSYTHLDVYKRKVYRRLEKVVYKLFYLNKI